MGSIFDNLVSGSRVVYANGDVKIALFGTDYGDILTSRDRNTYANLDDYTEDGIYFADNVNRDYDIVEISNPKNKFRYLSDNESDYEVVWQKKAQPIKLTLEELREILGEDFVICG